MFFWRDVHGVVEVGVVVVHVRHNVVVRVMMADIRKVCVVARHHLHVSVVHVLFGVVVGLVARYKLFVGVGIRDCVVEVGVIRVVLVDRVYIAHIIIVVTDLEVRRTVPLLIHIHVDVRVLIDLELVIRVIAYRVIGRMPFLHSVPFFIVIVKLAIPVAEIALLPIVTKLVMRLIRVKLVMIIPSTCIPLIHIPSTIIPTTYTKVLIIITP